MRRFLLLYGLAALLLLAPGSSMLAGSRPQDVLGTLNDVTQQPDPKKKEITASVARSAENETLSLNVSFPDETGNLKVALYNILGKLIEVHPISAGRGDMIFRFQTKGLPTGPYIIVLESDGQRIVNKVMLSR